MEPITITSQEIFDAAWQAFIIEQRPLSMNDVGDCYYRGPNNSNCAVGLCIPDDFYTKKLEGRTAVSGEFAEHGIYFEDAGLAREMQRMLHDTLKGYSQQYREHKYRKFAEEYELTIPTGQANEN